MKAYESGKEAEHHFTDRFISDPKELHPTLRKMNLHTFKTAVKPKKDKKGKYCIYPIESCLLDSSFW